jgi:peptidoglycan hydrolase-like protein with peptidoglycan-binding domain
MHLRFRHAAITLLVALAGCSAGAAGSAPNDADPTTEAGVGDTSAPTVGPTDAPDTTVPLISNTTAPVTEPTVPPTTAPTTAPSTAPESTAPPATTTTQPVEPVRLPERVIRPITAMVPPLEPVGTSNGAATERAQWRLLELGFWLEAPDGRYDPTTYQAVMAFQKYYGLETDGSLGPETAGTLSAVTALPMGASTSGTLVEVDKSKQLAFLVYDGVTKWILNTSTGTEVPYDEINKNTGQPERGDSVTRTGVFAVDREREEGWWAGDLGEIYRPKYFDGGIALHGSNNIPAYPASHGCVRLSTMAMDWIWEQGMVPMGTTVWVHGQIPGAEA